jgi:hypothetical protein
MKALGKVAFGALMSATALTLAATSASARIVCNADGDCWHTTTVYEYPPAAGVVIHDDDWKWGPSERYTWREHEGRGYWRGGVWTDF